jgi:hypothetical protein
MGNTRDTGYLRNLVAYDASGNIVLPANLTVTGSLNGTSATFNGTLTVNSSASPSVFNTVSGQGIAIENSGSSNKRYRLNVDGTSFKITEAGVSDTLTIASGGAVSFTSSVTSQVNNISADGAGVVLQGYVDNNLRIAVRGSGYNSGARGGLLASTGDFSGQIAVSTNSGIIVGAGFRAFIRQTTGGDVEIGAASGGVLALINNNSIALSFNGSGAATFSSSVTAATDVTLNNGTLFVSAGSGQNYSSRISTAYIFPYITTYLDSFAGAGWEGRLQFRTNSAGGAMNTALTILNNGNVGIGTNNPGQKLEVVGGEIKAGRVDSNEEGGQVSFARASDNATGWYIDSYGSTSTPALRFVDVSNGSVRMTITSGGVVRIASLSSNGLVGTDASGNLGVVISEYTEIATGTITYSMNSGSPWAINNSFPATIRNYEDDGMVGSGGVATSLNLGRGVTFDLGSAKAVRRIVERGYHTKNLNQIIVQYSTDNSNWTDIYVYNHVYGNTQKNMEFNPTRAISARYWRWFIHSWSEREVQNYYTYESIIYT